jgi:hypothetical protein
MRIALLAALLTAFFAGQAAERAQANVNLGVLPLCTTSSFDFATVSNPPYAWKSQIDGNTALMGDPVGPGVANNCAAQLKTRIENTCTSPDYCPHGTGYDLLSTATAFPNTVAASGGDNQHVTISIPGVDKRGWASCLPMAGATHAFCPGAASGEANDVGKIYYRFKDDDGNYTSRFTISAGDTNPGFRIQRVNQAANACANTSPECTYEIYWKRGTGGGALQSIDAQIVMELPITYSSGPFPVVTGYVGIPMEIAAHDLSNVQTGDGSGSPSGAPPKDTAPPVITAAKTFKLKAKTVLKKGAAFPISFSESSSAAGSLTLAKSTVKKLGLGKKALVLGSAKSGAAASSTLTIKLNKKGKSALGLLAKLPGKKLKLTLLLTATDSAGNASTKTVPVTIS